MRPDSVPDLGAIQIIYLLTYLLIPSPYWPTMAVKIFTNATDDTAMLQIPYFTENISSCLCIFNGDVACCS